MGLSRWTDGLGTLHLSRIFRGSFAKFGCQKWQVQILNLNWALATVFNALYNPSCDTRLPQLRPEASTIPPVSTSRPFPLVHSHRTKQTIWNILTFSFATFREANYFRDLSRPSISLSRKWCSITPFINNTLRFFSWLNWGAPSCGGGVWTVAASHQDAVGKSSHFWGKPKKR